VFEVQLPEMTPPFAEQFAALEGDIEIKSAILLELVGSQIVDYLRSLTDKMQPASRRGEPPPSPTPTSTRSTTWTTVPS
jgi:hypothetical protein